MELQDYRNKIDRIDDELVELFIQRMNLSSQIAKYKKEHGLPIFVPAREQQILQDISIKAGPEMSMYIHTIYRTIFEVSKDFQNQCNEETNLQV